MKKTMIQKVSIRHFLGSLCGCGFDDEVDDFGEEGVNAVRRSGRKNADISRSGRKNVDVRRSGRKNADVNKISMMGSKFTSFMSKLGLKRSRTAESNMVTLGWDSHSDCSYVYDDSFLQNYRRIASLNISGIGGSAIAVGMGDLSWQMKDDAGCMHLFTERDVLHVPKSSRNILSGVNFVR